MMRAKSSAGDTAHDTLKLSFTDEFDCSPDVRTEMVFDGLVVQHVTMRKPRAYEYRWSGPQLYASLHDIRVSDGESAVAGVQAPRLLDLRDRLTVLPASCEVSGWSQLAKRTNQFTAIYLDPRFAEAEIEASGTARSLRPLVHFESNELRVTLEKLRAIVKDPQPVDRPYAEALAVVAGLEISRLQQDAKPQSAQDRGQLTASQERLIREAIVESGGRNLSLSDLAGLAKLSRFHFARAFKKTFGMPPHQFILHERIEQAKISLLNDDIALPDLALSLGFGSQSRFSEVFRKTTGHSPAQFRRRHR